MMRTLLLILSITGHAASLAATPACHRSQPLRITIRLAGEAPRIALLESTQPSGIRLRDPDTGNELWSATPTAASTQRIAGMGAAFGSSFTAVHLDGDGVHDRVYAGDLSGGLWRFDLLAGATPAQWMRPILLADLGATGGGRGFVARPDVSLIESAAGSWLNIAIGTASTGPSPGEHRFYVLRDSVTSTPRGPLRETDLARLLPPAGVLTGDSPGYFLPLGHAQVLAQSLTLNGRIHFTLAETRDSLVAACDAQQLPAAAAPLSVIVLRARDGAAQPVDLPMRDDFNQIPRRQLAGLLPASAGVELATAAAGTSGSVPCTVGGEALPGCALDTRPRRSWWRREDAD